MTVVKRKISGTSRYVKYSQLKPGETIVIGEFKGTEMVKAFDPKQPDVPQHTVLDEEGVEIKLNSAGQLNHILKNVPVGTCIEIIYLGKEKIKVNGRQVEANQFEVSELYDDEAEVA